MTKYIDVFNGDADGLCALQQLRLADPQEGVLVSGPKRDISLLQRVTAQAGDHVTVLDISLDKNREALLGLLAKGVVVRYFDHHYAGDVPAHASLEAHIDTSPEICTSLLVNNYLHGRFCAWAVTGAFGDNFPVQAREAARPLALSASQLEQLSELGTLLNYNGYGEGDEIFFPPDELFRLLHPYTDPFEFIANERSFAVLRDGYRVDMAKIAAVRPEVTEEHIAVYILPNAPWARRASGVFANELVDRSPARAHAILSGLPTGGFQVSVRAPRNNPSGADTLCRAFPSGGGRKAAAGINCLPETELDSFIEAFRNNYR
ncbi:MAG TPA: acetyltransferase [Gammaproteobacteria bacterium]